MPASLASPSAPVPAAPVQNATPGGDIGGAGSVEASTDRAASAGTTQRTAGVVVGAVGVLGLGIGAGSAALAASNWSSAKSACNGMPVSCTTDPDSKGFKDASTATTMATVADVGFIAGGVLVGTGIVLYLAAPKRRSGEVRTSSSGLELVPVGGFGNAGMMIRGSF